MKFISDLPYPGLRAFGRNESHLFFGRDGCVDQLIERLAATRFLAVLGASGSGKSSLVRTGLLSSLELGFFAKAGARWTIAELTPGGQPLHNLAAALIGVGAQGPMDPEILRALLARGPRSLVEWCRNGGLAEGHNLLILVDQFEELFRYGDYSGREEAEALVGLLLESAKAPEAPIHVVLTMRSEYIGACALIPGLAEEINAGFYLTPRMLREEWRSAIEGPAAIGRFAIEPALVNQILNDMASFAPWEEEQGVARGQLLSRRADQLPLMQHLLNRLWLRGKARAGDGPVELRFEDYDAVGGLVGALDAHGKEVMDSLDPADRADVQTIFRALVSGPDPVNAIRRPCQFDELAGEVKGGRATAQRIVDAFRAPDCNFLRPEADVPLADDTVIDISHESLIRQWAALARWLHDEARAGANWRRLLTGAEWRGTGDGGLLTGLDLASLAAWWDAEAPTARWAERHGGRYEDAESFLADSRAAEAAALTRETEREALEQQRETERTARDRRRLLGGVSVLAVLLAISVGLGIFSFGQMRRAEAQAEEAGEQAARAEAYGARAAIAKGDAQRARNTAVAAAERAGVQTEIARRERNRALAQEQAARRAGEVARNAQQTEAAAAARYAAAVMDIQRIIYSPRYQSRVGFADLQRQVSDKIRPLLKGIQQRHSGALSPAEAAENSRYAASTLEAADDTVAALAIRQESFDQSLAALRHIAPDSADYQRLAQEILANGFILGWTLLDVGRDDEADRALLHMDDIARRYSAAEAPARLVLPLARHHWLRRRYALTQGRSGEADRETQTVRQFSGRRDAPGDDLPSLATYEVWTTPRVSGQDDPVCPHMQRLYSSDPYHRDRIIQMATCHADAAFTANRLGDRTNSRRRAGLAALLLDNALELEPTNSALLLARTYLQLRMVDIARTNGDTNEITRQQMAASESFVLAVSNRSLFQRSTNELQRAWNSFSTIDANPVLGYETPESRAAFFVSFYQNIRRSLSTSRQAFRNSPSIAYVYGDASAKLAVHLLGMGRRQEAEQANRDAISAFSDGGIVERASRPGSYSDNVSGVCYAYGQRVRILSELRRADEAREAHRLLWRVCGPALNRYPWDFYLRWHFRMSAVNLGRLLHDERRFGEATSFLQYASDWGDKQSSERLADIYLHGRGVPADAARAQALTALASRQSMKRFTVPLRIDGAETPFFIYVSEYGPGQYCSTAPAPSSPETNCVGFEGIDDQAEYARNMWNSEVSEDIVGRFRTVNRMARERNLSFPELAAAELGPAPPQQANASQADTPPSEPVRTTSAAAPPPSIRGVRFFAEDTRTDPPRLTETADIPYHEGSCFRWVIDVPRETRTFALREEFELPAPPNDWGLETRTVIALDGRHATTDFDDSADDGLLTRSWCISRGDPVGTHHFRIFFGDRLLHQFDFEVLREEASRPDV